MAVNAAVFLYQLSLADRELFRFIYAYGMTPYEVVARVDLPPAGPQPLELTLLSSMFLHGGWLHFLGNMLYLWVFGDNIEDALGHLTYLGFYLLGGLAAAVTHILVEPYSRVPTVGASGAIAAVLGAYLVLYPRARIISLITFGYFIRVMPVPAVLQIGLWAIIQLFSGAASLGVPTAQSGGVAYWAHIGGFIAGVLLILLLRPTIRRRPAPPPTRWR